MSGKYIIGGVAAAGAAYYLYENKRLQQEIHQPKSWTGTKFDQLKGDTVGAKIDKNINSLHKTADKKTDEAKDWADAKGKEAKDWAAQKQKETESFWKETGKPQLEQKLGESKQYLSEKADSANARVGGGPKAYGGYYIDNNPNKNAALKVGDYYIDTVNAVAFAVHDGVYSVKDAVFGTTSKTDELQSKAKEAKKDASSWFGNAFNKAEKEADKAAGKAQKEANKAADKAQKSWYQLSGDTDKAISDVSRGYGENSSFWAKEEAEEQKAASALKEAKNGVISNVNKASEATLATIGSAKEVIDRKSAEAQEQVTDAAEAAKPWFGLKSIDQRDEERLDKLIAEVSRGYGENATFFAKESYDDVANKPVLIQELRDKATQNLKEAKENLDKHRTHWWSWASAKDKELEKTAKEQWENAQVFYDDVEKRLVEGNEKFKQWTDSALQSTKSGLNYANEKTQDGLTGAQKWLKNDKK